MPDAFIARQPIFNHKLEVVGYELLFRGQGYGADALIDNPEAATATVILNSLTELELKRIVGHKTAWFNVSREFVVDGLAKAIPPGLVGLEIPENLEFDEPMVAALRDLKDSGYRLALDDFCYRPGTDELLELFDVVKLNMLQLGHDGLTEQIERLKPYGLTLVADKLGTRPDHEFAAEAGVDLFQGYFFCRPAVVGTRGIAANRLALLQVVAALHDADVQLEDIEQIIARDVALSYRLLRYVNSAFFGLRSEVRSIGQALALLGVENVRRWATLSVLASVDNKPTELTVTALIRARFCELAGRDLGIARSSELFTLGLFSVIDGMMDAPMHDVVGQLPLASDIRDALTMRKGELGGLLDCVAALEGGEYEQAQTMVDRAGERYVDSLVWATTAAESLYGEPSAAPAHPTVGLAGADGALATRERDESQSKPPPGLEPPVAVMPADTEVEAEVAPDSAVADQAHGRGGALARAWARFKRFFRRRGVEAAAAARLDEVPAESA